MPALRRITHWRTGVIVSIDALKAATRGECIHRALRLSSSARFGRNRADYL